MHYCDHALSVVCHPSIIINFLHFRLLWNRWTEFNETWQEARAQCPLPSSCFSRRSENQDGRTCLWLAEIFSTSLKPLKRIQRNMTGSKNTTSSTMFVRFFSADRKTNLAALASDWNFIQLLVVFVKMHPINFVVKWSRLQCTSFTEWKWLNDF